MTKDQLWKAYTDKNPQFLGSEPVTLTPAGLKKLFDQTFDMGYDHGLTIAKKLQDVVGRSTSTSTADNIFEGLFRK